MSPKADWQPRLQWQATPAETPSRVALGGGGDPQRVASLFEAHNKALLRFLTCRLRSAQEAHEVAQEAYVRLLQLDAPDGVSYLRAYLFKTAANLATDRLRSTARRARVDQLEFFEQAEEFEPSAETNVAAQQELATILTILDELPPRCRYAFVMHRFYGHSIAEVAGSMALSARMVQLYVERALAFCSERLHRAAGARR
jgi:RNA polymerase sigma factor (sigma-70 family)